MSESLAAGALGDAADNSCSAPSPVRNFTAILDDMNYRPVLDILGVGTFQFTRRKLLTREFRALYVGLWRLALMRSFPTRHAELFQAFMEGEAARCKDRRQAVAWAELVMQYAGKLSEHGDADFSDIFCPCWNSTRRGPGPWFSSWPCICAACTRTFSTTCCRFPGPPGERAA